MTALLPPEIGAETSDATTARETAMVTWMQEIAPYGIVTTDTALRIQSWNEWLATHSGMAADTVIGKPLVEVFPDLKTRRLDEQYQRALCGEVSVLATALHRYLLPLSSTVRTGTFTCMQQTARIAPLTARGNVVGTITVIEDVTQREAQAAILRRQHDHDRLLSWALAHLLQSTDPFTDVGQIFPQVAEALGLELYCHYLLEPDGATLRLHSGGGIPADERTRVALLPIGEGLCGQIARERAPVIAEHVLARDLPHGDIARRCAVRAFAGFPLMIGERLLGTLAFATSSRDTIAPDETEFLGTFAQYFAIALDREQQKRALRQAQEKLSQHAELLESKIAERTAMLNETIAQLESFSYTLAHDLRAPIRSLNGYCEILLSDYRTALPEPAAFMLQKLARASLRLDALTRDLLRFSKVSRQTVQLEVLDLDEVIHELRLATPALQDGVLEVVSPLGRAWAQRTLLQQCFSNLFDNALKFVAPGTRAQITVHSEMITAATGSTPAKSAGRVKIYVIDNGIGIPPHAHQKIFGIFERLTNAENVEGTGIGLAIVARACEQMGGACGVESTLGQGSRFWIELGAARG